MRRSTSKWQTRAFIYGQRRAQSEAKGAEYLSRFRRPEKLLAAARGGMVGR